MPDLHANGAHIRYQVDGDPDSPALLLLNSLGTDYTMWTPQVHAFAKHFSVLRFDFRGQGASTVTPGPYTIAQLAADAIALLDLLELQRVAVCGLSMGGLVAQHLAIHAPHRVRRLILCCTAARIGSVASWNERIATVASSGLAPLVPVTLERWFTSGFHAGNPLEIEQAAALLCANHPNGYIANCAAIRDADNRSSLSSINAPTLILCGEADPVTPPADSAFLAAGIMDSTLVTLKAAHLANIEQPQAFNAAVLDFLRSERI